MPSRSHPRTHARTRTRSLAPSRALGRWVKSAVLLGSLASVRRRRQSRVVVGAEAVVSVCACAEGHVLTRREPGLVPRRPQQVSASSHKTRPSQTYILRTHSLAPTLALRPPLASNSLSHSNQLKPMYARTHTRARIHSLQTHSNTAPRMHTRTNPHNTHQTTQHTHTHNTHKHTITQTPPLAHTPSNQLHTHGRPTWLASPQPLPLAPPRHAYRQVVVGGTANNSVTHDNMRAHHTHKHTSTHTSARLLALTRTRTRARTHAANTHDAHIHTRIISNTRAHAHTHTQARTHIHTRTHTHTHTRQHARTHAHAHTHAPTHACTHVHFR
jgi:hypothetical protein